MESLSNVERVMLINQYEILKRIDTENASHYKEMIDIIRDGYSIFYSKIDERLSKEMPMEDAHLVLDILDFYDAVEEYKSHHPEDKEIHDHAFSKFAGFYGNTEIQCLAFATFLIKKQSKFAWVAESLKSTNKPEYDQFNSHMPCADIYRRILNAWQNNGGGDGRLPRTKAEILVALNATSHKKTSEP